MKEAAENVLKGVDRNAKVDYTIINYDDFVGSPTSVLRCTLRHRDVLSVRLTPQELRALNLELFTLSSNSDFLRDYRN